MTESDMFGRVSWLVAADDAILGLLGTPQQIELSPADIAHNTGYTSGHIQDRLAILVDAGLAKKIEVEGSYPRYTTTELGEQYVADQLTAQELEELDPTD
jgi:predicted transcriptional regulator